MRIPFLLFASVLAVLVAAGSAPASAGTKEAYARRVEPVCKAGTKVIERLLDGTRKMANNGRPVAAGRRFIRASNVFADTVRRVSMVHRAAADRVRLGKWIDRLRNVKEAMRQLGISLKHRNRLVAFNRLGQLRDAGTSANRAVAGFHLHYCRIYASRFS